MLAAVGVPLSEERCWVDAAEPLLCRQCNELVVFDRGIRCVECDQSVDAPEDALVGFIGRIPALIAGRPYLTSLQRRLELLEEADAAQAAVWRESLLLVEGREYLAPRYGLWFSASWPHSDPPVMVWPEYFDVLDIPPDHVYYADQYFRLCLYANWRERPACEVLQNRVVPRLLIDLMVADLEALGKMDQALDRLDVSLYELYNMVGRPEQTTAFQRLYEELVGR
jgi:hypothetical protein